MRVYIAGPMTGHPQLNFPAFHAEAARLRALGYEVVNPAELNADPAADWLECMRTDIKHLVDCDAIAMLEGWHHSRGARLEYTIALMLGHAVFRAVDIVEGLAA
ncbi:DUF4406 domain-containing protein [Burkholderia cepacia]|uniref:DUF4406 domain-containing protein n=1 Tax=Burkholderia cepacia TaxID=292 RepID=UPI002AB79116|nr:DUF4406 domain-containing protein [Burkholderia cepacia]